MSTDVKIAADWKAVLQAEFEKPYFQNLTDFVRTEYASSTIYPKGNQIFRALDTTPFDNVKVVILGQDPYHGPKQANGLCFSVDNNVAFPPSLRNIFKELASDLSKPLPENGDLSSWARQGVLLLNATLTVKAHAAGSHQNKGWEIFTDAVIAALNNRKKELVYMLWGSYAQKKGAMINANENLLLKAPHPSPLSAHRGFLGCGHFSKANEYLLKKGKEPIAW